MFFVVAFRYFVACDVKVTPFRTIDGSSLEKFGVSVAGSHGEHFFADRYRELSPSVFTFVC